MLEVYHHGSSVCAAKVRIVLEEKGIPWTGHYVDILAGEQFHPAFLKINPKGAVPVIMHDGRVLNESSVIAEYLDDAFDGPALKPADPMQRAHMRLWTKRVDEEIHPCVRPITYVTTHRHSIMEKRRDEVEHHINSDPSPYWRERKRGWIYKGFEAPDVGYAIRYFASLLREMDTVLAENEWLVGDSYTLADVGLTPFANRLELMGFTGLWAGLPHYARWFDAIKARPSFKPALYDWLPDELKERMQADGRRAWPEFQKLLAA
jgi:glutathione S-transferase